MTIGTVRVALLLYVTALVVMTGRRDGGRRLARVIWSAAALAYLAHVVAAFQYVHGWSHQAAVVETARQTRELFGMDTGVGIWFNYLFTVMWVIDVAWWWLDPIGYVRRSGLVSAAVHGFMAFMFFNGAVVFAHGPTRWIGLAATLLIPVWWMWRGSAMRS